MKRLVFLVFLGVAGAYVFRTYAYEGIYIASGSMEPTLPKDRHVMVNKFSLLFKKPQRGDIVMFDSPLDAHKGLVKRVMAVGGDTIEIRNKKVVVNGQQLYEGYVQYQNPETMFLGDNLPPMVVPQNHLFVMGDNRDVSGDSRDWRTADGQLAPFLPLSNVRGLVQGGN